MAYQMLAQEPWCYHPEQIASLTDWQIEHLYVRPVVERSKQMERAARGQSANESESLAVPPEPGSPEFKGWIIAQFMAMGMSRNAAEQRFKEQQTPA